MRIIRLAPLNDKQIHSFVSSRIPKPDNFIQALYQSQAWEFAGRPQDITDLISYWKKFSQLGTLHQLIEFNITEKLKEPHPERPNPLPYEKAREGVERLAAATVFCKRFTFPILDRNIDLAETISPDSVLPQWNREEIDSILNRALFDSAIYGRIKFHHRRTSEYLAASWLQSCLTTSCDYSQDVEPLLFIKCYKQTVIPPSLAPTVAWLAVIGNEIWNQRLKKKLLGEHPEILIKYGDPQSLSIDDRRLLLQKIVMTVTFSPDGHKLASGHKNGQITLWNLTDDRPYLSWQAHQDRVSDIHFNPKEEKIIATAGYDKQAKLWNLSQATSNTPPKELKRPMQFDGWVNSIDFSPDGSQLAIGSENGKVELWDIIKNKKLNPSYKSNDGIRKVIFNSNGRLFFTDNKEVKALDTGKNVIPSQHTMPITDIHFSSDDQLLITASSDKTMKIWYSDDDNNFKILENLTEHEDEIRSISMSPDNQTLLSTAGNINNKCD